MTQIPRLRPIPELPDEIVQAAPNGNLVFFVGAGASMLLDLPSWSGMARQQLEGLREKGALNYSELHQLSSLDPKTKLSIAKEIADENKLGLDLTAGLTGRPVGSSIYKLINDIGCVCVTTNYDTLLAPRHTGAKIGSVTPAAINRIYEKNKFLSRHLDTPGAVIHLHGAVTNQETMIVTTKDYLDHYDNEFVQEFLSALFEQKTVLFIGYGLDEAEILEHVLRQNGVQKSKERKRFILQGYFLNQKPLYEKLYNYYRNSFGIHVVGFVRDHKDYRQQEDILKEWGPRISVKPPSLATELEMMDKVLGDG